MIYSKTCEYAVRALSYLATKEKGSFTMVPEVSQQTGVPGPYIAKIFQSLVKHQMLESRRGPIGGFSFKKNPQSISLAAVVRAVDDDATLNECVMGLDQCNSQNACPLHFVWGRAKRQLSKQLADCRITDIKKKIRTLNYRGTKRFRLKMTADLRSTYQPLTCQKVTE